MFATVSLHLSTYPVFLSLSNQHSMQRVGSATDEIEKPVSRLYYREHTVAEPCDYKIVDSGGLCFQLPQPSACGLRKETTRLFLSPARNVGNGDSLCLTRFMMIWSETVSPERQFVVSLIGCRSCCRVSIVFER